jgi:single-strand DNA-binding protein
MAILATQTLVGSIGRKYELRTVGKDQQVIDFSIAVTPRKKVDGEWTDGETYWLTVTAWGRLAKNIDESFNSGDRVFVFGRTEMKAGYTNKEGVEVPARSILIAEFAGHEVSYNPAHSDRPAKGEGGGGNFERRSAPAAKAAPAKAAPKPADDDLDFGGDDDDFSPF